MSHSRRYSNSNNPVSSHNRLSDRDIMVDLINTEKHLSHLYEHAIMESVNSTVHNTMEEFQHDEHENAYTLYKAMQDRGWYKSAGQEQKNNYRNSFNVKSAQRSQSGMYTRSSSNQQYQ